MVVALHESPHLYVQQSHTTLPLCKTWQLVSGSSSGDCVLSQRGSLSVHCEVKISSFTCSISQCYISTFMSVEIFEFNDSCWIWSCWESDKAVWTCCKPVVFWMDHQATELHVPGEVERFASMYASHVAGS